MTDKKISKELQAGRVLRLLSEQIEEGIVKSAKVVFDLDDGITVESYYEAGGVTEPTSSESDESSDEEDADSGDES